MTAKTIPHPSKERLRELFDYKDGKLIRREKSNKKSVGKRSTHVDGKQFQVHRLIWIWHNGPIKLDIVHKNGLVMDHRIENLKQVSSSQHMFDCLNKKPKNSFAERYPE